MAAAKAADAEKARQAAETKAADAEKARQTASKTADDADKARQAAAAKAAEADKARQAAEAKAAEATDAAAKSAQARQAAEIHAAEADKARLAAEAKAAGTVTSGLASPSGQFSQKSNMEGKGRLQYAVTVSAKVDCEQTCAAQSNNTCKVFSYHKKSGRCYNYSEADLYPNEEYDSGVLATVATVTSGSASSSGQFSRRSNVMASGSIQNSAGVASIVDCERTCAQSNTCKVYTYMKKIGLCYMYSVADLLPNENYDSGIRN